MGHVRQGLGGSLVLVMVLLLGGCAPAVLPAPAALIPPDLALSCLTPLAILLVVALIAALVLHLVRGGSSLGGAGISSAEEIAQRR
ncbi:MAG: hypothetical protein J7M34_04625, partial [Anaerolineae bacterium]|nr:hypothetical protein [Anaerolineae bacterium]